MIEIEGYGDLEVLGRGGFAVVYRATQLSVGRDVAIKLLIDPAPDNDLVRRFQRESRAVGSLSWHPHIAAVVDAGATDQGQAYIVFELLDGGSLEEQLASNPMPWNRALSSMIQIADAVEAAHRADVLHRDIKPANILLDRLGVAKLGDFGIASMQDGTKTETGMLATTVAHAAPELFDGQPSSTATDVYALGSTLHTLVTGAPPFAPSPGERVSSTIGRIMQEPPPRPDPATVPSEISVVIAHALAKQPQYRPRSAAAFGHALQRVQRELGDRVTAMPVSDNERSADNGVGDKPAVVASQSPNTLNRPFTAADYSDRSSERPSKPFARTIVWLSAIAVLAAAAFLGAVLFQARRTVTPMRITAGGAEILSVSASPETATEGSSARDAVDLDNNTSWVVAANPDADAAIAGTIYLIRLTGEQEVVSVGISNADTPDVGRIASIGWATSRENLITQDASVVTQRVPDEVGEFLVDFGVTTDLLVLQILEVHDGAAPNAGIAEVLVVTNE